MLGRVGEQLGLGLFQLSLKRSRIDHKQQVAFIDLLALNEMNLGDSSADLRLNVDGLWRHDSAEFMDLNRDIHRLYLCYQDVLHCHRRLNVIRLLVASLEKSDRNKEQKKNETSRPVGELTVHVGGGQNLAFCEMNHAN